MFSLVSYFLCLEIKIKIVLILLNKCNIYKTYFFLNIVPSRLRPGLRAFLFVACFQREPGRISSFLILTNLLISFSKFSPATLKIT